MATEIVEGSILAHLSHDFGDIGRNFNSGRGLDLEGFKLEVNLVVGGICISERTRSFGLGQTFGADRLSISLTFGGDSVSFSLSFLTGCVSFSACFSTKRFGCTLSSSLASCCFGLGLTSGLGSLSIGTTLSLDDALLGGSFGRDYVGTFLGLGFSYKHFLLGASGELGLFLFLNLDGTGTLSQLLLDGLVFEIRSTFGALLLNLGFGLELSNLNIFVALTGRNSLLSTQLGILRLAILNGSGFTNLAIVRRRDIGCFATLGLTIISCQIAVIGRTLSVNNLMNRENDTESQLFHLNLNRGLDLIVKFVLLVHDSFGSQPRDNSTHAAGNDVN